MKAAKLAKPTAPQTNLRSAGAASLKSMLFALKAENERVYAANGDDGEMATPEQLSPIIEAAVAEANGSGAVGFRSGFYAALAEWLAPTVDGCLATLDDWEPLAERTPPGAVESVPERAKPVPPPGLGAEPLHVTATPAAPLKVSAAEADSILEQISIIALSASGLAAQAVEEAGGDLALVEKVHGTQKLLEMIGALADSAIGGCSRGSLGQWCYGKRQ